MGRFIDLTWKIFERLTVLGRVENDKYGKPQWLCKCICGNEKITLGSLLKNGQTKSCGCLGREVLVKGSHSRFLNLTQQRFERLLVNKYMGTDESGHSLWLCECICGEETIVRTDHLKNRRIKSCGCLHNEGNNLTHGRSHTITYKSWINMRQRCNNPNNPFYKDYGGRGITVCDRWNPKKGGSFENFLKDMGECPPGMSIDRIDNDKLINGYSQKTVNGQHPKNKQIIEGIVQEGR